LALLSEGDDAFERVFAEAFRLLDAVWVSETRVHGVMEFPAVLR
jgi:hypothetical protein